MFDLVLLMQCCVIRLSGLPHLPQDFQPALAKTPQSTGVALAFVAVGAVINLRPHAILATQINPKVDGLAKVKIARPTNRHARDLAGLKAHRSCASEALHGLRILESLAIF